jgi:hypothetical protein
MAWKPITLALFSEFQRCLQDKGIPESQFNEISDCFQATFNESVTPPPDPGPDPEPEPEPVPGTCLAGFLAGSGWWDKFCIDEPPKFKSENNNGVGVMGTNANGYRRFATSPQARGKASIDVFYRTAQIPQDGGGGHLFTAQSGERALSPNYLQGWFRPDIISSQSKWKIHTYNLDGNGNRWYIRNGGRDAVVDIWDTGIPNAGVGKWIAIALEWERRAADKMWMRFTADGQSREKIVTVHSQTTNPYSVSCGNMDHLGDYGGTPEIAFRNLRWT